MPSFQEFIKCNEINILREHREHDSTLKSFLSCVQMRKEDLFCILTEFFQTQTGKNLLEVDYGGNANSIDFPAVFGKDDFLPIIFATAAVSSKLGIDLILVCDELNLSFLHKGSFIVRIGSRKNELPPRIVSLTDLELFLPVAVDDLVKFLELPCTRVYAEDFQNKKHTDRKSLKSDVPDEEAPYNSADTTNAESNDDKMTMSEFIDCHSKLNGDRLGVSPSAYSSNTRVDVTLSDYRMEEGCDINFERTVDIDGLFAILKPSHLSSTIQSGASLRVDPNYVSAKEATRIRNFVFNAFELDFERFEVVEIGTLIDKNGIQILFCRGSSCDKAQTKNIFKLFKEVHGRAIQFPCVETISNSGAVSECEYTIQHRADRSGRPTDLNQIKDRNFSYDYGIESFSCVMKTFRNELEAICSDDEKYFFYFKSVGSKFTSNSSEAQLLPKLMRDFVTPFKIERFLEKNGPRLSFDLCIKLMPTCSLNNVNNI